MATTGERDVLRLDDLHALATHKDLEALPTRKELVKLTEKLVERGELTKLATRTDLDALARQADVQALAVQTDDAREQLIEEMKQLARTADGHFQQLWMFLSNPPADASVPLLKEVMAVLRPPRAKRTWWVRYRRAAGLVIIGVLIGGGTVWWRVRPPAEVARWAQVGWTVDKVLVEYGAGCAKSAQEAVKDIYKALGLTPPTERKGKR